MSLHPQAAVGRARGAGGSAGRAVWACFAAGLLLSLLMVWRSQVGGDQLNLLARGWLLEAQGRFISFGNPMSTGGKAPGGFTSLLVGLPLIVWPDHRAATLVVLLFHAAAFVILDRTLARIVQPAERLLFALLYWLSPWRFYYSGFLWNPNYLCLFASAHLATAFAQRRQAGFWASFLHLAALVLAAQVHPSALLLAAASALLWLRGYLKIHLGGAIAGFLAANLPLIPWYREVLGHPALLAEANKGFLGRGLLFSLPRGLFYWLRYASLSLAGRTGLFDFTEALGAAANRWLTRVFWLLSEVIGPLSVVLPLLGSFWLLRRYRHRYLRRFPAAPAAPQLDRAWLHGYVILTLVASAAVFIASPTTLMYWQAFILFHAAVLPLVLWSGLLLRTRHASKVVTGAAVYAALALVLTLGMTFGSPDYRCAGRETVVFPLCCDSPMFGQLHIQATCPWPLDQPGGWWPDILPKSRPVALTPGHP
ncbi:MAG TPA: hypothetical protein VHR45_13125 [Thermoanaerobaculia bacterium]|nr:hypothetical protein [Thermoanaerobaculia bacterium]